MFLVLSFSILFNEVIKERNNLRRTRGDNASGTGTGHLHSNFGIAGQCVARKRAMWKLMWSLIECGTLLAGPAQKHAKQNISKRINEWDCFLFQQATLP